MGITTQKNASPARSGGVSQFKEVDMKRLVEFPLENGDAILVEVETDEPEDVVPAARVDQVAERASQTFEVALEKVKPVASTIITKLRGLHDSPDEIAVEFGIKLNAKAGAVIAAAGVEANFKVTLTWKQE
jgi:hypothetical protein